MYSGLYIERLVRSRAIVETDRIEQKGIERNRREMKRDHESRWNRIEETGTETNRNRKR